MSTYSQQAYDFIKSLEGKSYTPYADGTGNKRGYSIGYGHWTKLEDGEEIPTDLRLTDQQIEDIYKRDLQERYNYLSNAYRWFNDLNDNQKTAIQSYYYNRGVIPGELDRHMSRKDYAAAAKFLISNNNPKLQSRREKEAALLYNPEEVEQQQTSQKPQQQQYMPPVPGSEEADYNMQELYNMMISDMQASRHQPRIDNTYNELSQRGQLWTQDIWNRIKESSQNLFSELSNI